MKDFRKLWAAGLPCSDPFALSCPTHLPAVQIASQATVLAITDLNERPVTVSINLINMTTKEAPDFGPRVQPDKPCMGHGQNSLVRRLHRY